MCNYYMYVIGFFFIMAHFEILGSQLHIICTKFETVNNLPTGKEHYMNIWDINNKLGAHTAEYHKFF